jgi:hypothetical protein
MLSNILDFVKDREPEIELSTLEKLEQKNSENASERHLLEYEENYDSKLISIQIFKELTVSTTLCSGLQFALLKAVEGIDYSFNPFPLGFLMMATNLGNSLITSDSRKKSGYRLLMGACKFGVNTSINSTLLTRMTTKHQKSVAAINTIKAEIAAYESGYKPQSGLPIDSMAIALIAGVLLLLFLFRKK